MIVNVISESEYLPKDNGVHTAYINMLQMLQEKGVKVLTNSSKKTHITHIHTASPYAWYKLLTTTPNIISAHVIPDTIVGSVIADRYLYTIAEKYYKIFYNQADLVLAVAPKVRQELVKLGIKSRIEIFPNPINCRIFKKDKTLRKAGRDRLGLAKGDFVVLGVGHTVPRKGISDFIKLAKMLPALKFVWVGAKPFKFMSANTEEMRKLLKTNSKNFILTGPIKYQDMPSVYNAADIFFFPSYQENASMAIIEAAACGLPLVLRDLPEYRLLYRRGYLAAKNNDEFKKTIEKLLTHSQFYKKAANESRLLANKFSFERLGNLLLRYYASLQKQ